MNKEKGGERKESLLSGFCSKLSRVTRKLLFVGPSDLGCKIPDDHWRWQHRINFLYVVNSDNPDTTLTTKLGQYFVSDPTSSLQNFNRYLKMHQEKIEIKI